MRAWETRPLGEICSVSIGRTPSRKESGYWGRGYPWLSIRDMQQGRLLSKTKEQITDRAVRESSCRLVPPQTVVMSFKLSIGKVGITQVPLYTNEAIAALPIVDPDLVDTGYLSWYLACTDVSGTRDRAAMGSTLNKAKLEQIPVVLPPTIGEQRRIAAILDHADSLRTKRREAIAHLNSLTESIFIDMFESAATPGHSRSPISALLSEPLRNGQSPSTSGTQDLRVMTLSAITGDRFNPGAMKIGRYPSALPPDKFATTDDFLVCRGNGNVALVGRGEYFALNDTDVVFPDTMIALRFDPSQISRDYISHAWRSRTVRAQIESGARTTNGTYKINQTLVRSILIPLPRLEEQQEYASRIKPIRQFREDNIVALRLFDDLFSSLQSQAFQGEL